MICRINSPCFLPKGLIGRPRGARGIEWLRSTMEMTITATHGPAHETDFLREAWGVDSSYLQNQFCNYSVVQKKFPPVWNSRLDSAKQNGQPMHSQLALTEHASLNLAQLILLDPVLSWAFWAEPMLDIKCRLLCQIFKQRKKIHYWLGFGGPMDWPCLLSELSLIIDNGANSKLVSKKSSRQTGQEFWLSSADAQCRLLENPLGKGLVLLGKE